MTQRRRVSGRSCPPQVASEPPTLKEVVGVEKHREREKTRRTQEDRIKQQVSVFHLWVSETLKGNDGSLRKRAEFKSAR